MKNKKKKKKKKQQQQQQKKTTTKQWLETDIIEFPHKFYIILHFSRLDSFIYFINTYNFELIHTWTHFQQVYPEISRNMWGLSDTPAFHDTDTTHESQVY